MGINLYHWALFIVGWYFGELHPELGKALPAMHLAISRLQRWYFTRLGQVVAGLEFPDLISVVYSRKIIPAQEISLF